MPDHHQLPGCVTSCGQRARKTQTAHVRRGRASSKATVCNTVYSATSHRTWHKIGLEHRHGSSITAASTQGMIACKLREERQGRRTTTSAESNALFHAWIRLRDATIEHSACRRRRQQKNAGSRMRRSSSWPPAGTGGENTVT
jgi:hypothetical protein